MQEDYRPPASLTLETRARSVLVSWAPSPCAQHYVILLRRVSRSGGRHREAPRINDDEDYDSDELGETGRGGGRSSLAIEI